MQAEFNVIQVTPDGPVQVKNDGLAMRNVGLSSRKVAQIGREPALTGGQLLADCN